MASEEDWRRLGALVRATRARRWRTRRDFADVTGVSERTLGRLERGEPGLRDPDVLAVVEATLGWAPGSVTAVLGGGKPMTEPDEALNELLAAWPTLDRRVQRMILLLVRHADEV